MIVILLLLPKAVNISEDEVGVANITAEILKEGGRSPAFLVGLRKDDRC